MRSGELSGVLRNTTRLNWAWPQGGLTESLFVHVHG